MYKQDLALNNLQRLICLIVFVLVACYGISFNLISLLVDYITLTLKKKVKIIFRI